MKKKKSDSPPVLADAVSHLQIDLASEEMWYVFESQVK